MPPGPAVAPGLRAQARPVGAIGPCRTATHLRRSVTDGLTGPRRQGCVRAFGPLALLARALTAPASGSSPSLAASVDSGGSMSGPGLAPPRRQLPRSASCARSNCGRPSRRCRHCRQLLHHQAAAGGRWPPPVPRTEKDDVQRPAECVDDACPHDDRQMPDSSRAVGEAGRPTGGCHEEGGGAASNEGGR